MIESEETFVLIGEVRGEEQLIDFERGGAGNIGTYDEVLFEGSRDSWDKGSEVGSAHAMYVLTPSGRAVFNITLALGDEDSVTAAGVLPHDGGIRDGVITVTGGTGRFKDRRGQLRVEWKNPHKYSAEI